MNRSAGFLLALGCFAFLNSEVHAQFTGQTARNMRTATQNFLYNRPSVSPYVNLASRSSTFGLPNYHTFVRPRIEAEQEQLAQRRQTAELQQELSSVRNQFRQSQMQASSQMTTGRPGWSARGMPRFGSTLNYYPRVMRRR